MINRFPRNTHSIDPFQRDTTQLGKWDIAWSLLHCIALHCVAAADCGTTPGCSAMQDTLRKLSLFFKYFLRCEYYGTSLVKYAFTNILSLSNMFILYCNILFDIV